MTGRRLIVAIVCLAAGLVLAGGVWVDGRAEAAPKASAWKDRLAEEIPLLGHRNWIAVVDSAYPAQVSEGVETVVTGADQIEVVRTVLEMLDRADHVQPVIFTDAELPFVAEQYAPGIGDYRRNLAQALGRREVNVRPHEEIIQDLDEAGATFRVLVLKTNLALPYTSVFLRLDCGYWTPEAEQALRDAMATGMPTP